MNAKTAYRKKNSYTKEPESGGENGVKG